MLLVAAFPPELERARACGVPERALAEVGVGLVAAALGAREAIARAPARATHGVVLVGTCGVFGALAARAAGVQAVGLDGVVAAGRLVLADGGVAEGRAAFVGAQTAPLAADPALEAALVAAGARAVPIATTLAITTDDALAAALARAVAASAEHLEAYAVAAACAAARVPFACALGVANEVGAVGRGQWQARHREAAARACDLVLRAFPALVRGAPPGPGAASDGG